jgi:multiple sugar transport system permease protein
MKPRIGTVSRRAYLGIWILFAFFPLYWTVINSFKNQLAIFGGPKFIPFIDFEPTLDSWSNLFGSDTEFFFRAFTNSIIFSTLSSFLAVTLGGLAAYGLVRYEYRYGNYRNDDLSFLIVSQRIMPPVVSVLALYLIFKQLHLLDSTFGMTLAYTSMNLPLTVYLLKTFIASIPVELEYAAAIDGYSNFARIRKIIFPLAAPGLASAFLLSFFFAWNDFLFALMMTFNSAQTLPLLITSLTAQSTPSWPLISCVSLIALIPPAVVTVILDRFMVKQVLQGGIR